MTYFDTWTEAITASFQDLFAKVISYLPNLIAAIIVLILGVLIAASLGKLVQKLIHLTKVDKLVERLGLGKGLEAVGKKFSVSAFLGWLVKWFLIVLVLIAVAGILELPQITDFLNEVARFLPNVVIAVIILLIGFVAGNFVYELVEKAVKVAKMHSPKFLANLAKWSIIIFALMAALIQLKIAASLIETLFTGLIAMIALGGGLALGLGGKDHAKEWISKVKKEL